MISDLPLYTVSRDELEFFVKQLEENGCTEILQGLYMVMLRVSIKRERACLIVGIDTLHGEMFPRVMN